MHNLFLKNMSGLIEETKKPAADFSNPWVQPSSDVTNLAQLPTDMWEFKQRECTYLKCFSPFIRGGFVEHLSGTYVGQQSVIKIIYLILINLDAPKARAKHEHLFNKPASD